MPVTLLKSLVSAARQVFLEPLPLLLLLSGLALAYLWRVRAGRRRALLLLAVPYLTLVGVSLPVASYLLMGSLEWAHPPLDGKPSGGDAIVVLSGGLRGAPVGQSRPELSDASASRTLLAAELYHEGPPRPVIVTGGMSDEDFPEFTDALVMGELLERLGVPKSNVIVEPLARNTYQNAVEVGKILRDRRLGNIVLVTDAFHMRRSLACFGKQGIEATAAGCSRRANRFRWKIGEFIPSDNALGDFTTALHEWIGLAWYRVRGRI
jgi:uncharacterized SAM-binding protein YcdF (DUF218 family)